MRFFQAFFSRLFILAVLALAPLGAAGAAEVVVEGAGRVSQDTIRSYFTGTNQAAVNRGVSDLSATGMFSKVGAKIVNGQIIVSVVESNRIINRVAFEGNSKLKGDQLTVEVHSKGRSGFDEVVAKGDLDRIKEAYKKYGRNEAKVTYRLVSLPNGRVDLVFTIDEGDKTGVREIKFVGNEHVSNYRLHGLMATSEMNFLSFFKTSDVYQPDQVAQDEEAIRKYYMRNGYADFHITNTDVHYQADPAGYNLTISMEEGPLYRISSVSVDSHLPNISNEALQRFLRVAPGSVYNATAIEKTTEALAREVARLGYAFSSVRPHGDRNNATHEIAVVFSVDDGPKVYVERIDVVGNTRTRDYVIRREFDIGEGDPYNHALVERAERKLNSLGFFKKVHISNRPGTSPDRVVVVVEVEDKPTGSISLSGGYSTTEGALAEVAYTETNFLGRGQYLRLSASYGQYSKGWKASFTEPHFLETNLAAGFDLFHSLNDVSPYTLDQTWTTGGTLRVGIPINDELTIQPSYSLYASQVIIPNTTSNPYNDCFNPIAGVTPNTFTPDQTTVDNNCLTNGEASVALKQAAAQGISWTSMGSYSVIYNNLDDRKNPSSGVYAVFKQDFAGLGGQSKFVRETFDGRYYYPITDDFVGMLRAQGGQINAWGGQPLRIIDNFNVSQTLVRGFAPGGIGPRDLSDPNSIAQNGLGGTTYFGGTAEVQFPLFGLPRELGLRGAVFFDAGTLFNYTGATNFSSLVGLPANSACFAGNSPSNNVSQNYSQSNCVSLDDEKRIRSSIGASLLWASPLGPIRFDYAYALTKGKFDQTQAFSFSGGTQF